MLKSNVYDRYNRWHPNLDFVGCIDPFLQQRCCGSVFLIHKKYVLTASHCLDDCQNWHIVFPFGQKNYIVQDHRDDQNDVAWCELQEEVEGIEPVSIIETHLTGCCDAIMAGWGVRGEHDEYISKPTWAANRIRLTKNENIKIEDDDLAPSIGEGDSGGPVLVNQNNKVVVAGMLTNSGTNQKYLYDFKKIIPQSKPFLLDDVEFSQLVQIDYRRRSLRKVFCDFNCAEWRQVDEWLRFNCK